MLSDAFRPSLCGGFIVERNAGEVYDNVMTLAVARQVFERLQRDAASYERDYDVATAEGREPDAYVARSMAVWLLDRAGGLHAAMAKLENNQ